MLRRSKPFYPQEATDQSSLMWITYFLFIFSVIFVGDYYFAPAGIYGYWLIVFFGAWFFLSLTGPTAMALLAASPFVILLMIGLFYKSIDASYYQAPIFALISIAFLGRVKPLLFAPKNIVFWFSLICLLLFSIFVFVFDSGSSRTSLIFGPTILYRVILFFYGYCLIFLIPRGQTVFLVLASALAFYSVLKIGSRGGIVALGFMWLLVMRGYINWRLFAWIAVILTSAILIVNIEDILSSRAFYFSSESESSNVRLDKLRMIYEFLKGDEIFFGMNYPTSLVGNYPHNIFAEMLIFHGLIAFLFFCIINLTVLFLVFRFADKNSWIYRLVILTSPIIVGAQFSGSLLDNYFYISIMFYIIGSIAWVKIRASNKS